MEERRLWSSTSLDAVLLTLWSLLIIGASATLLLKDILSPQYIELSSQLTVVFFILLSAYRLGLAYETNALFWYPVCYALILVHSFIYRGAKIRTDTFIEHVFYAMMGFLTLLAIFRVYRYYKRKWGKKKKST